MTHIINRERRRQRPAGNMRLNVLQEAVTTVIDACSIQVNIKLEPDGFPAPPGKLCKGLTYGSSIALTSRNEATSWTLALIADEFTSHVLTRALFAMENDEDVSLADMADALGELPNVAAGSFKATREKAGENLQLGLPIFSRGHSYLTYLPFGINAVAQTLVGEGGLVAHVVLIWRDAPDNGEKNQGATICDQIGTTPDLNASNRPELVLAEAIDSVINTCEVQIDLPMEKVGEASLPGANTSAYGCSIALTSTHRSWNLALFCNKNSTAALTRTLFAMEANAETSMEDMSDALGEIVNVAAGTFKKSRMAAGQEVQLGLPLFIEGNSCVELLANGIQGLAQGLKGPDGLEAEIVLIWQEGKIS